MQCRKKWHLFHIIQKSFMMKIRKTEICNLAHLLSNIHNCQKWKTLSYHSPYSQLMSQYLLCPPWSCNTAAIRLGMDAIKVLTRACGIVCSSWRRFCGAGWRWRTQRSSSSHRCSIGLRSGERAGQRITLTFCCSKKSVVMRAVCGRALSCWNTSLLMFIAGNKCGLRISSRYRTAFKLPGTVTSCVFRAYEIAAHIITLPPPKLSTSTTQFWAKRSLRRLYTLIRPSLFSN